MGARSRWPRLWQRARRVGHAQRFWNRKFYVTSNSKPSSEPGCAPWLPSLIPLSPSMKPQWLDFALPLSQSATCECQYALVQLMRLAKRPAVMTSHISPLIEEQDACFEWMLKLPSLIKWIYSRHNYEAFLISKITEASEYTKPGYFLPALLNELLYF